MDVIFVFACVAVYHAGKFKFGLTKGISHNNNHADGPYIFFLHCLFLLILHHYDLAAINDIYAFGQILRVFAVAHLLAVEVKHTSYALMARCKL